MEVEFMRDDHVSAIKTGATLNLLAGIWLFVSPWVYRIHSNPDSWNSWIVGAIIAILAAIRIGNPLETRGVSIVNLILGIWTFASPWIYGYTGYSGRFANSLIVGVIVFALGVWLSSMGRTTTTMSTEPPPLRT
ncbi:MAG: SPW repeat protein [Limisphaerales bacterium]